MVAYWLEVFISLYFVSLLFLPNLYLPPHLPLSQAVLFFPLALSLTSSFSLLIHFSTFSIVSHSKYTFSFSSRQRRHDWQIVDLELPTPVHSSDLGLCHSLLGFDESVTSEQYPQGAEKVEMREITYSV